MERMAEMPLIPELILIEQCGWGSCSEVWLGSDRQGNRRAVRMVSKRKHPALLAMERQSLFLYRASAGNHTNLLPILAIGETAEYLYSIMEPADNVSRSRTYYKPDTLAKRIFCRMENIVSILNYLDAILAGIERLHERNIAHGDLKA